MTDVSDRTYLELAKVEGPIVVVEGTSGVGYGEIVEIRPPGGATRTGQVLEISERAAVVQVFEGTQGLATREVTVRFLGRGFEIPVGEEMLGRVFDGLGRPIDGAPEPLGDERSQITV